MNARQTGSRRPERDASHADGQNTEVAEENRAWQAGLDDCLI